MANPIRVVVPIFYNEQIMKIITNAVRWACQRVKIPFACPNVEALEHISPKDVDFGKIGVLQKD